MCHVTTTQRLLHTIFDAHRSVVVWLSSGKDSTTLLHLLRPWAAQVHVLANILDGGFEGIESHIEQVCAQWGFQRLTVTEPGITFDDYVALYGWPVRVVPTAMDGTLPDPWYDGGLKVSSFWHCTTLRVLAPLIEASHKLGADAVLTGSRSTDAPAFARQGPVTEWFRQGVGLWTRYNPLQAWTTEDVWAYIDAERIPLPAHYSWKRHVPWESPDCVLCPYHADYVRWLRGQRPGDYNRLMAEGGAALRKAQALATHDVSTWEGIL